MLLFLLLAWHFSIQAAAHQTARQQVRVWLQGLGATAERVDFRMLRGALTIHNIKASYQGNPLHIQQVLIKGNPASIATNKPMLQHVVIQQLSIDAYAASQSWENLNYELSPSLKNIFYFAKTIDIQNARIQHIANLPDLIIDNIHVSGISDSRKVLGHGYIGTSTHSWTVQSLFPSDASQQTGHISSLYQNIQSDINWSGSWSSKNFKAYIQQQDAQAVANLLLDVRQIEQQWSIDFDAQSWPVRNTLLTSSITGQGNLSGNPNSWLLTSKKMQWFATIVPEYQMAIANATTENLEIDNTTKHINISNLELINPELTIDTSQDTYTLLPWQTSIENISVKKMHATILVANNPIKLPELDGTAKAQQSEIQFDLSSQSLHDEFWRVQTKDNDEISLTISNTQIAQLRNLLPDPLRQQALTLQGNASLKLTMQPARAWATAGEVQVSNIHLASKNQTFKAEHLKLDILHADNLGMHQASLDADHWFMQFPLTPIQAWTEESHLDEWASIPWTFNRIHMRQGKVALGNKSQVWLKDAELSIQDWQSQKLTKLKFHALFGTVPLKVDMDLKANSNNIMQWQALNLHTQGAGLAAAADWLKISDFPLIGKGHMNINLSATRDEQGIQGITKLGFSQLTSTQHENDVLLKYSGTPTQHIIQRLSKRNKLQFNASFQGQPSDNWTTLAGQSLLQNMLSNLSRSSQPTNNVVVSTKILGSLRLHQENPLSQNERSRLRKMILSARRNHGMHIELKPDLGTAEFTTELQNKIQKTQSLIKAFMTKRGIAAQNIYLILPQEKHQSTSSAGAIHINLVK